MAAASPMKLLAAVTEQVCTAQSPALQVVCLRLCNAHIFKGIFNNKSIQNFASYFDWKKPFKTFLGH